MNKKGNFFSFSLRSHYLGGREDGKPAGGPGAEAQPQPRPRSAAQPQQRPRSDAQPRHRHQLDLQLRHWTSGTSDKQVPTLIDDRSIYE